MALISTVIVFERYSRKRLLSFLIRKVIKSITQNKGSGKMNIKPMFLIRLLEKVIP